MFLTSWLPRRVPAVCLSKPRCSYYCSYSPGKKPLRIEEMVISDAGRSRGRWPRRIKDAARNRGVSVTAEVTVQELGRNLNNHEREREREW